MIRRRLSLAALALPLALAACGDQPEGESADDFASRVNAGDAAATPQADGPRDPSMPRVAANGAQALSAKAAYTQPAAEGETPNSLAIRQDGTFTLVEDGRTLEGGWEWLPDGKRLRLKGVVHQPIVLVADGALYRMQNENVPFDDVTPDRMYTLGGGGAKK